MGLLINGSWHDEWYDTSSTGGEFIRTDAQFRNTISNEAGADFPAEADRYHLFVSLACPWAHRTLILRKLKRLEHVIGVSIVAPTGSYDVAKVSLDPYDVEVVNPGKNVWSLQPSFSMTYLNTENGREFSGATSLYFNEKNGATDYLTAPAITLETAFMQHLPNGWAVGATGYWYEQLGDDSGTGAVKTRAALLTDSLRAVAFGIGPLATYSGEFLGQSISLKAKYISEFSTKRAFEKDVFWVNVTATF